jgi:hypothetical protein
MLAPAGLLCKLSRCLIGQWKVERGLLACKVKIKPGRMRPFDRQQIQKRMQGMAWHGKGS